VADLRSTLVELGRLQEAESTLVTVDAALGRVPGRIAEIEASLAAAEKELAAARAALQDAGKERRSLEQDVEVVRIRITRHQDQLMEVKTNEQYRALNKEIATERSKIEEIEEKILLSLERSDELQRAIKQREGQLAREKERVAGEKATLLEERGKLEGERAELEAERARIAAAVPADALRLYRRIAGIRGGIAISRVEGESCGECRVRARPQPLAEARAFERLVQCESCQRILLVSRPAGAAPSAPETPVPEA
jgi:hypothetical protein